MIRILCLVSYCSLCFLPAEAQISVTSQPLPGRINAINTAIPFVEITGDAISGALGDIGVVASVGNYIPGLTQNSHSTLRCLCETLWYNK